MNHQRLDAPMPEPYGDAFPAVSPRRRRGVRVTTAAAVALGLAVSGGAVAGAGSVASTAGSTGSSAPASTGSPTGRPPFSGSPPTAVGTVKSVGDWTFTVTAQDGTTGTVDVGTATTYRDPGVTSPTSANLTVGEHVAVFGTEASGVVTASSVAIGDPPSGKGRGPGGQGGTGGPGGPGGHGCCWRADGPS